MDDFTEFERSVAARFREDKKGCGTLFRDESGVKQMCIRDIPCSVHEPPTAESIENRVERLARRVESVIDVLDLHLTDEHVDVKERLREALESIATARQEADEWEHTDFDWKMLAGKQESIARRALTPEPAPDTGDDACEHTRVRFNQHRGYVCVACGEDRPRPLSRADVFEQLTDGAKEMNMTNPNDLWYCIWWRVLPSEKQVHTATIQGILAATALLAEKNADAYEAGMFTVDMQTP